jgi:hypothetical protein
MKNRRERLARARDINDQLWRLEQIQLAQAEKAVAALRAAESASFASLGQGEPRIILPYIASLVRRRGEAENALLQARERALEIGRRMKLTEKLHKAAEEIERRGENRVELRPGVDSDDVSAP